MSNLFKTLNTLKDDFTIGKLKEIPRVQLTDLLLINCKVLPNREVLLERLPSRGNIAEIGVSEGNFSEQILDICQPKKLHLIDNWSSGKYISFHEKVLDRFNSNILKKQVIIHKDLSLNALKKFQDGYFDWVYIDTIHDYHTTKRELELCAKIVKMEGFICGHDYTSRSYTDGLKYGVIEAVHEFCKNSNWEFIFLTLEPNGHNSFALKKIS